MNVFEYVTPTKLDIANARDEAKQAYRKALGAELAWEQMLKRYWLDQLNAQVGHGWQGKVVEIQWANATEDIRLETILVNYDGTPKLVATRRTKRGRWCKVTTTYDAAVISSIRNKESDTQ